jgi:hypothetical protein
MKKTNIAKLLFCLALGLGPVADSVMQQEACARQGRKNQKGPKGNRRKKKENQKGVKRKEAESLKRTEAESLKREEEERLKREAEKKQQEVNKDATFTIGKINTDPNAMTQLIERAVQYRPGRTFDDVQKAAKMADQVRAPGSTVNALQHLLNGDFSDDVRTALQIQIQLGVGMQKAQASHQGLMPELTTALRNNSGVRELFSCVSAVATGGNALNAMPVLGGGNVPQALQDAFPAQTAARTAYDQTLAAVNAVGAGNPINGAPVAEPVADYLRQVFGPDHVLTKNLVRFDGAGAPQALNLIRFAQAKDGAADDLGERDKRMAADFLSGRAGILDNQAAPLTSFNQAGEEARSDLLKNMQNVEYVMSNQDFVGNFRKATSELMNIVEKVLSARDESLGLNPGLKLFNEFMEKQFKIGKELVASYDANASATKEDLVKVFTGVGGFNDNPLAFLGLAYGRHENGQVVYAPVQAFQLDAFLHKLSGVSKKRDAIIKRSFAPYKEKDELSNKRNVRQNLISICAG